MMERGYCSFRPLSASGTLMQGPLGGVVSLGQKGAGL
jgi:hypothetical protein